MLKSGECLPLSYWLILADAENSSIPARTPNSIWEIFIFLRAILSRIARRDSSLDGLTIPKIILVFTGFYTKTSLVFEVNYLCFGNESTYEVVMDQANNALEIFNGSTYYEHFFNSFLSDKKLIVDLDKKEVSQAIFFHLCKMKYAGWRHRVRFNRGVKHSLSEIFQDVIAFYLKASLPVEYSVELEVSKDKLRPDIVIKKNGTYHFILEIKTNIGYNRSGLKEEFNARRNALSKAFGVKESNIIYVFEEHTNVSNEFSEMYWDKKSGVAKSVRPDNAPYSFIYPLFNGDDPYYWDKNFDSSNQLKAVTREDILKRASENVVTPFEDILKLIQSA